jgi:pentatricopeptide repeat protein
MVRPLKNLLLRQRQRPGGGGMTSVTMIDFVARPKFWCRIVFAQSASLRCHSSKVKVGSTHLNPKRKRTGSAFVYHREAILECLQANQLHQAQELYLELLQAHVAGNRDAQPDTHLLTSILQAWLNTSESDKEAAWHAESLMKRVNVVLEQQQQPSSAQPSSDDDDALEIRPTIDCYNLVMECWSRRSKDPNALDHALSLLQTMEFYSLQPTDQTYFLLAKMKLKRGDLEGAQHYSKLLNTPNPKLTGMILNFMSKEHDAATSEAYFRQLTPVERNTITYSIVMSAFAREKQPLEAERLLLEMVQSGTEACLPDRGAFHIVMDAWANSKDKKAAERVESLLTRFWHYYESGQISLETVPSVETYEKVISCWLRSKYDGACLHAEDIVRSMQHYHSHGFDDLQPTPKIVNLILEAWIRRGNPERAESLLHAMAPDSVDCKSYLMILNAWSSFKKDQAATRIPALLGKVHGAVLSGTLQGTTVTTMNKLLDNFATHGFPDKGLEILRIIQERNIKSLRPDTISYNTVMNGFATIGRLDTVETMLHEMIDNDESGSQQKPLPTSTSFAIALKALSKQDFDERNLDKLWFILDRSRSVADTNVYNNAIKCAAQWHQPGLAMNLIQKMMQESSDGNGDALPDQVSFGTAIAAYTKGGNVEEAVKLFEMVDKLQYLTVDCRMYCALMAVWAKSEREDASTHVEKLFDEMNDKYLAGNRSMKPDSRAFHIVMSAVARTGDGSRVEHYLRRPDLKPTVWHYNAAILAWSKNPDAKSFEKAESLLHEMQSRNIRPDAVTYFVLLQMLSTRSIPDKERRTESIISNFRESNVEADSRIEALLEALDVIHGPSISSSVH